MGDISARDTLLIPKVLVDGHKYVKLILSQRKEFAIFFTAESRLTNRLALMPALGKKEFALMGKHSSSSNFISELLSN